MKPLAFLWLTLAVWAAPDPAKPDKSPKTAPPARTATSITGCIDQIGEKKWVVKSLDDMSKITALRARGFSDDGFARFLGHRVTLHGRTAGDVFEVTKIDDVAPTCRR